MGRALLASGWLGRRRGSALRSSAARGGSRAALGIPIAHEVHVELEGFVRARGRGLRRTHGRRQTLALPSVRLLRCSGWLRRSSCQRCRCSGQISRKSGSRQRWQHGHAASPGQRRRFEPRCRKYAARCRKHAARCRKLAARRRRGRCRGCLLRRLGLPSSLSAEAAARRDGQQLRWTGVPLRAQNVAPIRAVLDLATDPLPVLLERVVPLDQRLQLEAAPRVPDLLASEQIEAPIDVLARDGGFELFDPKKVLLVESAQAVEANLQLIQGIVELFCLHVSAFNRGVECRGYRSTRGFPSR